MKTWLVFLACLFWLFEAVGLDRPACATVVLKYASTTPSVGFVADQERKLANEIEKRTQGRVKLQIYFGGSLLKIPEGLEGVSKGIADIALIPQNWFPSQIPLGAATQYIHVGPPIDKLKDPIQAGRAMWKLWDNYAPLREELHKWGVTIFSVRTMPSYQMWSKVPIRSLSDLKGLRVRELGIRGKIMFASYGAIPVTLTPAEMYSALQKGLVDVVCASLDWGELYKLKEVAPHLVLMYSNPGAPYYIINANSLKKLSKDDQETVLKIGRDFTETYALALRTYLEGLIEQYRREGVRITEFTDREKWRREAEPKLLEATVEELKKYAPEDHLRKVIELFLDYMGGGDVVPWRR
ncbi:MAG: TRAP transporter substrate-binding protein DctP [candidate division WOR-3 bacterium]